MQHVVILGVGLAGLALSARLSQELAASKKVFGSSRGARWFGSKEL